MIDQEERRSAAEIEQSHPHWVVMWGCYSRLFWAFPRFQAARGTIVSARNGLQLLADMHRVEIDANASRVVQPPRYAPASSTAPQAAFHPEASR
jgi:hypothetical protein